MRKVSLEELDRALIGDIWTSEEVWENLVALCDGIGARFAGTPGERKAADYLAEKAASYGLEGVRLEEFAYAGWTRGSPATLEVLEPERAKVACLSLPRCPRATVEGEVVNLRLGLAEDFRAWGAQAAGKVALIRAGTPTYYGRGVHRREKLERALAAGAVGMLWANNEGGQLLPTGSLAGEGTFPVPCVGISSEDAALLERLGRKGKVRVRIRTQDEGGPAVGYNVVAELPGIDAFPAILIAGAHYDTHDISPGAADNGSGTVAVLEAARALAKLKGKLPKTLRFIWFSVEEMGLVGSRSYVAAHQEELKDIQFMFNLDVVASGGMDLGVSVQGWSELVPFFQHLGRGMRDGFPVADVIGLHSDHYPFTLAGVPSGGISSLQRAPGGWTRGFGHTPADTLDKVSPRDMRFGALLLARVLLHLSFCQDWPARHRSREEVKALLEERGLRQELEVQKSWPF